MNLTVHTITNEVASYYRVTLDEIYCTRRKGENIKYKHISIYFMKHYLKMSHASIGGEFPGKNGRLDHATVTHALKSIQNQIDTNSIYRKEIDEIGKKLNHMIEDKREVEEEVYMENDVYTEKEMQLTN